MRHLDRILSPTIFSTPTNRRIFRGMVYVTDTESWQRIFQLMSEKSRWDLPDADVAAYLTRSFDFIVDFLRRVEESEPYCARPVGRRRRCGWRSAYGALRCGTAARSWWRPKRSGISACRAQACDLRRALPSPLYPLAGAPQQLIHLARVGLARLISSSRADEHAEQFLLAREVALATPRTVRR